MRDWWGEVWHKVVVDSGGSRVYYFGVQGSLNFHSVRSLEYIQKYCG